MAGNPNEKRPEKKKKGEYDRYVIACLDSWPIFSYIDMNWRSSDGKTLQECVPFKLRSYISHEDRNRDVLIKIPGLTERNCRVFARVEKGFEKYRLDEKINEWNNLLKGVHDDQLAQEYAILVDDFYEKLMAGKNYERRLPDGAFNFDSFDERQSRQKAKNPTVRMPIMSDDRSSDDQESMIRQRALKTAKFLETLPISSPAPEAPKEQPPKRALRSTAEPSSAPASMISGISREELDKILMAPPKPLAPTVIEAQVPVIHQPGPPVIIQPSPTSLSSADDDNLSQSSTSSMEKLNQAILDASSLPGPSRSAEQTIPIVSHEATFAQCSALEAEAPEDIHNFTFSNKDASMNVFSPKNSRASEDMPSNVYVEVPIPEGGELVTGDMLKTALALLFDKLHHSAMAMKDDLQKALEEKMDEQSATLKKKIDNKFQHVMDVKKSVSEIEVRLANFKQQVISTSPAKSFSGSIDLRGKARLILFRHLKFNYMGVACDVFFACHFVQEQLCNYILPYLRRIALGSLNHAVAKTCLLTCFTPLARAHLIFGKFKNSTKNMYFNKRPLPDGLHSMIDNYMAPALEDFMKVAHGSEVRHIANIKRTCSTTFSTDRSAMITTAIVNTHSFQEAAEAVADCDFLYREYNKHHQKATTKVPSREEFIAKTLTRSEFGKSKSKPLTVPVQKDKIFADMMTQTSHEILDPHEMLRQIIVAAHLFGQDYANLKFDKLDCVPDLPDMYREVLDGISDINALVAKYSADASAQLPEITVEGITSPERPGTSGNKRATATRQLSFTEPSTSKRAKIDESLLSDDSDDSNGSMDDFKVPSNPPAGTKPTVSKRGLKVILPKRSQGVPAEILSGSSSSGSDSEKAKNN